MVENFSTQFSPLYLLKDGVICIWGFWRNDKNQS